MQDNTPVDDQFLAAMGLTKLGEEEKKEALETILYTLNMRVGMRVSEQLSEEQLDQFEQLTSREPDQEALSAWLGQNVPNYSQIIEEEAQTMRLENKENVERALGKSLPDDQYLGYIKQ